MKFWHKIENLLNKIIIEIGDFISNSVKKLTPSKVKKTLENTKNKSIELQHSTAKNLTEKVEKTQAWSKNVKAQATTKVVNTKQKVQATKEAAKSYDWKSLNAAKIFAIAAALLGPLFLKLKTWLSGLKPTVVISGAVGGVVFSLLGITIVQQASEIESKTTKTREPSSISDTMDKDAYAHSSFRHHKKKKIELSAVNIPIYIEQKKGHRTVKIDFTFVANNRYVAQYFKIYENEFLIRDRLSRKLHPIIPNFPMEDEGKNILKSKIKAELNELIKELKIEGKIEEVFIHSMLNG